MSVHNQPKQPQALIGIDWTHDQHAFHVITADGTEWSGTLEHSPQAIDDWLATIRQQLPQQRLAIILEQSRGALITALMKYDQLDIYPINPGKLSKYRESMNYSGCKDDPTDAQLLAQYLQHYQSKLRVVSPDSPETRQLALLTEDRRRLVERRKKLANELTVSPQLTGSSTEQALPRRCYPRVPASF